MDGVFLSYRREDSRASAGRLYETLKAEFGRERVFKDVDSVELGIDFRRAIEVAIGEAAAMVVVIGPDWLPSDEAIPSRLDEPDDFVRVEIEQALKSGLTLFPVLVDGGATPSADRLPHSIRDLAFINAAKIDHDSWDRDCQALLSAIHRRVEAVEVAENLQPQAAADDITGADMEIARPADQQLAESGSPKTGQWLRSRGFLLASIVGVTALMAALTIQLRPLSTGTTSTTHQVASATTAAEESTTTTEATTTTSSPTSSATTAAEEEPQEIVPTSPPNAFFFESFHDVDDLRSVSALRDLGSFSSSGFRLDNTEPLQTLELSDLGDIQGNALDLLPDGKPPLGNTSLYVSGLKATSVVHSEYESIVLTFKLRGRSIFGLIEVDGKQGCEGSLLILARFGEADWQDVLTHCGIRPDDVWTEQHLWLDMTDAPSDTLTIALIFIAWNSEEDAQAGLLVDDFAVSGSRVACTADRTNIPDNLLC